MKSACIIFVSVLLIPTVGAICDSNQADLHRDFIQAHHAQGQRRAAYVSPDGLYIARISFEDGEVKDEVVRLTISRKGLKKSTTSTFSGVEGFAWVPQRRHTLVVSTDGGHNGTGVLAIWTAEKGTKVLISGKDLGDDNFDVKRISGDWKKVVYEHFGYGVNERHPEHGSGLHQLVLPPSRDMMKHSKSQGAT